MLPEKFRRQLRQEAQRWQAEGLITETQFRSLADRYEFDRIDIHAKNRFTLILLAVGCVLIGLGVITFVAANWQDIPRVARVFLLLGLFIGVSFGGFTLWRPVGSDRWQRRFGEALLLLASLILGANIALMAQMFHISGSAYSLFLTWGFGVLAMAYGLRLPSIGALAILLIGIGYWQSWWESFGARDASIWGTIVPQMPIVSVILFLPLAYACRSKVLFLLSAIAVNSSLLASLAPTATRNSVLFPILIVLPAALLWSYDDTLWGFVRPRMSQNPQPFQRLSRRLAVLYLGGLFYWLSFYWGWNSDRSSFWYSAISGWQSLPSVVILLAVAIVQWIYLLRYARTRSGDWNIHLNTILIFLFINLAAITNFWHIRIQPIPVLATVIFNALLALLAIGTIRNSLGVGDRRSFWFGMVFVILQIFSRLVEYDTNLLLKSLIFILCGVGVIMAGLWFERYVRTLTSAIRE